MNAVKSRNKLSESENAALSDDLYLSAKIEPTIRSQQPATSCYSPAAN